MTTKITVCFAGNEGIAKVRGMLDSITQQWVEGMRICYLTGIEQDSGSYPHPAVEIAHHPGENIFQLRTRLPKVAGDCDWVVLLEDHNTIGPGWVQGILEAIASAEDDTKILIGQATNVETTSPWSWASFLTSSGFHWYPTADRPVLPTLYNCAVRRAVLGTERWATGEYEFNILAEIALKAQAAPSMVLDHRQHHTMLSAIEHHWHNGRAAGALLAELKLPGQKPRYYTHVRNVLTQRWPALRDILLTHPKKNLYPSSTAAKVRVLVWAHIAAALWGGWFGGGRSFWRLE